MGHKRVLIADICGVALLFTILPGCHGAEPSTFVVAKVNGQALTQADVTADAAAAGLAKGTILTSIRPIILNGLIIRSLLVQEARSEGLDRDPDYLAATKRAQDLILARRLLARVEERVQAPTPRAVQSFINNNQQRFGDRRIYQIDELRTGRRGLDLTTLSQLQSNDAAAAYLQQLRHPFERGTAALDTMATTADTARAIANLGPGATLMIENGPVVTLRAVTQSKAAPVPVAQRTAIATVILDRETRRRAVSDEIRDLHSRASINMNY